MLDAVLRVLVTVVRVIQKRKVRNILKTAAYKTHILLLDFGVFFPTLTQGYEVLKIDLLLILLQIKLIKLFYIQ